jgi:mannose-6-phosphate isomerase-like protein (cupin superfamily)
MREQRRAASQCRRRGGDCAHRGNGVRATNTRRIRRIPATGGPHRGARPAKKERSMTDVVDAPGIGHNQPDPMEMEKKHQKWDRWAKKRTFVRALEGTYSHLYKTLVDEKRVYSASDVAWKGGPQMFGKSIISPQATQIIQSIESHIEAYAPKTGGQKHGHLNSAVFYVLKGHGYDIHDGKKIPWKAGDVMLVENGCVHQHFNDSETEECVHLVFKAKPLFLFMHLLLQKMVEWPPELDPALGPYSPPTDL